MCIRDSLREARQAPDRQGFGPIRDWRSQQPPPPALCAAKICLECRPFWSLHPRVLHEKRRIDDGECSRHERQLISHWQSADIRLVAATHRNLEAEALAGRFRQDLYFRLGAAVVSLPPLRHRKIEIPMIARTFLDAARRLSLIHI